MIIPKRLGCGVIGVGVQGCTSSVKTSGSSFKTGVCNLEKKIIVRLVINLTKKP